MAAVSAESEVNVNNEEESDEEPEVEVVEDEDENKAPKKRKRLKVYVVFHGDRSSRRLPHSVRVKCPRDGSWEYGPYGPYLLKKAFCDRYAEFHGQDKALRLEGCYMVNAHGVVIMDNDELRMYVESEGVLHLILGTSPKKKEANAVLQWGYNALATSERLAPGPVTALDRKRVIALSCGWLHCCAVLDSGKAVAWGSNEFGQLGTGDERKSPSPVLCAVDPKARLARVACGAYFTNTLDAQGTLYSWGRYQASNYPTKFVETWANGYESKGEFGIKGQIIKAIAAGEAHTIVLTESGKLFSWGYNEQWQLGRGQKEIEHQGQQKPKELEILSQHPKFVSPAKAIAAGGLHSCVIDANGTLFAFGSNHEGQIGHVIRQAIADPQPVSSMQSEKCKSVYCGRYSTLALTEDGNAFFFGSLAGSSAQQQQQQPDENGQEDKEQSFAPSAMSGAARLLAGAAKQHVGSGIEAAALGEAHAILLSSNNYLQGWGYNAYGQALGVLDSTTDIIDTPRHLNLPSEHFDPATSMILDMAAAGGTSTLLVAPSSSPHLKNTTTAAE
mmetsp:Transcript_11834/g.16056  ORF Transcript_11834/g.16056 Transcript_11834/m.16056 type:complete len:558 (+) Transcript_11834:54-1727(+)|eukprot:CAMPEP_0197286486 /NCGR_PEP_ID=MMETSP0890-20130614/1887_1 /TAXON_ID=44058 ORGANISM="Aureoumbra lagunensis, Strain CCMP1510" /NCGR_SAMPLE_ID=MMETSP0890 /ASSEMBLY_ACC=CAM_ASM_000533 /LENGTH=557 /DNA_ID=CAMNT_0042754829 /DNA_START=45 /DNA_END=1718 /DNA_ORIENTATION=-